jgi:hypothetical protein
VRLDSDGTVFGNTKKCRFNCIGWGKGDKTGGVTMDAIFGNIQGEL